MELYAQINTFEGGMNTDTDVSMIPKNSYRYAQNIQILSDSNGIGNTLHNIEDIKKYIIDDTLNNSTIIGTTCGKAYNYLDEYTNIIWILTKQQINDEIYNQVLEVSDFNKQKLSIVKIVGGAWNISQEVQMVQNYESKDINKLYVTDGESPIKVFDLREYNIVNNDITQFEIVPSCELTPFILKEIIEGSLTAGQVQYCYQLFTKNGSETAISVLSDKIQIAPNEEKLKDFNGYEKEQTSQIGCILQASTINKGGVFDGIRIYRLDYISSTDDPRVYIINESSIPEHNERFTFEYTDTGSSIISEITFEEFNNLIPNIFIAQTIAKKDNRLYAANINEILWDVDYDARAYRCNNKGQVLLKSGIEEDLIFNIDDLLNGTTDVPENHDCINPLNNEIVYPNDENNYSYFKDNNKYYLGGQGKNISYQFIQVNLAESSLSSEWDNNLNVGKLKYYAGHDLNKSTVNKVYGCNSKGETITIDFNDLNIVLPNYAGNSIQSRLLSYQRDEIYRFGIVFYNNKNIPSPVHWIGDIRFPSADMNINDNLSFRPFVSNNSTSNGTSDNIKTNGVELISRPIGIEFTVNNIPEDAVAYQIVRCRRTITDRTVVTQGALNKTMNFVGWTGSGNIDSTISGGDSDLRPYSILNFSKDPCIQRLGVDREGSGSDSTWIIEYLNKEKPGYYTLTSTDVCFNTDQDLVKKGYYIIPLYCASHISVDSNSRNIENSGEFTTLNGTSYWYRKGKAGIQINSSIPQTLNANLNYFGQIVSANDGRKYAFIDKCEGYCFGDRIGQSEKAYIPAGLIKYYVITDKSNAHKNGYNINLNRQKFTIDATLKPQNIPSTYAVSGIQDLRNSYVDTIGDMLYRNIAIGSKDSFGSYGITTVIKSDDLPQEYDGISDTNNNEISKKGGFSMGSILIVNIKKNTTNQYGGNTYAARQNSIYEIGCRFVNPNYENYRDTKCFNGDTYLNVLDYMVSSLSYPNLVEGENSNIAGINQRCYVQAYIPLESSVNAYCRYDEHFSQTVKDGNMIDEGGTADVGFMTEPGANPLQTQSTPMYAYNSAYSNQIGGNKYVQKNIYYVDDQVMFNRVICSEQKTNNEITDNWTKFKFANYLDVDNQYGPITNLYIFNDKLYMFQYDAVSIASINNRSLITDNNSSALVLGTGGILDRYDYITINNGDSKIRDRSIVSSNSTMYWYDNDKNVICALNNSLVELTKVKSMQNYLNSKNQNSLQNVVSLFDPKYNEIWFKIDGSSLIFNEQLNCFTSFYTHKPDWQALFSDYLVTIQDNNFYYIHDKYHFENDLIEDKIANIKFIINDNPINTKVYDNVSFNGNLIDNENDQPKLITSVKFYTKTQTSEEVTYQNIENREDNYRFYIPREHQENPSMQEIKNKSYASRMRGKYLICDYTFDCNNKEISIPYIKTTYRNSMI